jgi:hypothetical protein
MNEIDQVIRDRITNKRCPICDKELDNNIKIVQDPKFGIVEICVHHKVEGEEYVSSV